MVYCTSLLWFVRIYEWEFWITIPCSHQWLHAISFVKVCPDDATLLLGTRDNVFPWSIVPRCPRVLQVLPTMSDSCTARVGTLVSYPTLLEALATSWGSVGQCSMGTLSHGAKLHRVDRPSVCGSQQGQVVMTSFTSISAVLLLWLMGWTMTSRPDKMTFRPSNDFHCTASN